PTRSRRKGRIKLVFSCQYSTSQWTGCHVLQSFTEAKSSNFLFGFVVQKVELVLYVGRGLKAVRATCREYLKNLLRIDIANANLPDDSSLRKVIEPSKSFKNRGARVIAVDPVYV